MVTAKLMDYKGSPVVINKNPITIATIQGNFNQPYSLMDPTLRLTGGGIQDYFTQNIVNYIKIEDKYYYVIDWFIAPNNVIELNLHIDVLMTYKSEVNDMKVILERSGDSDTGELFDPMIPIRTDKNIEIIHYPKGFSEEEEDGTYIMVTSQPGYTAVEP